MIIKQLVFDDAAGAHHSARSIDTNGFMHVDNCPLTKEQVAPYLGREIPGWEELGLKSETVYHVYRPANELSRPETVNSVKSIPFLLDHAEVSPENIRENQIIGNVGDNAKWDGKYLRCNVTVYAQKAQDKIRDNSMRELSLSYSYRPELKEGSFKGRKYEIVMHDIRANHLALVEAGRAGSDVRVNDGMPMELTQMENNKFLELMQQLMDMYKMEHGAGAADNDMTEDEDEQAADGFGEQEEGGEASPAEDEDEVTEDDDDEVTEDEDDITEDDDDEVTEDEDDITEDDDDEVTEDDDDEVAEDDDDEVAEDDDDEVTEDDDEEVAEDDDDEALINLLKAAGIEPSEENIATIRKMAGSASDKASDSARSVRRAQARKRSRRLAMDRRTVSKVVRQQLRKEGAALALNKIKRMQLAADSCKPILGRVNIYKFKSADEIWRRAAVKSGLSVKLAKDSRTARGYVKSELKHKASKPRAFNAAAATNRIDREVMAFLNNIEV